jgi:hypothetical protein
LLYGDAFLSFISSYVCHRNLSDRRHGYHGCTVRVHPVSADVWERNSIIFSRYMDARMSFPLQRRNLRGGHLDEGRYGFCYLRWQHDRYLDASLNTLCYPKQSEHVAYVRSVRFIV